MMAARILLLIVFGLGTAACAAAQWERLGARQVSFAAERDVVEVGAREGRFTAIRIDVADGDIEMYNLRVIFGDGDAWSPPTRLDFRQGSRSRVIDLPGGARVIRRIEFAYRSRVRRGRATVEVFGRTAAGGGKAEAVAEVPLTPGPAPARAGWEHLGSRVVTFRAERDAVAAAGQGVFRQLMFEVDGGDLELFDIRVTFGNGESWSPATRLYFREDSRSRTLNLPGVARVVRRVDFLYRSVAGGGEGRAVIHVYGR